MTDTPQGAWMREYERRRAAAVYAASNHGKTLASIHATEGDRDTSRAALTAAHTALDAHVRRLVEERDALRGLLEACLNELGDTSAERVGPRIETLAYHPPLTEPQRLRMEAERIERRDALIVRIRNALAAPKDAP